MKNYSKKMKIALLSDVVVGYGSPQLLYLLNSLSDKYSSAEIVIFEPDQKGRSPVDLPLRNLRRIRVFTRFPPYDEVFQIEYNRGILKELDAYAPDIVIFTGAWVIPALLLMAKKPSFLVYYMLESLDHQRRAGGDYFIHLNRLIRDHVHLILGPEKNRLNQDIERLSWEEKQRAVLLNVSPLRAGISPKQVSNRAGILYAGTIGAQTCLDYFTLPEFADIPISIAGSIELTEARSLLEKILKNNKNAQYLGSLASDELAEIRADYLYSLVMWRPESSDYLYACPNKFFESIAASVPPICAPHPQCIDIVQQYGCGILLPDWSSASLLEVLKNITSGKNSRNYISMVKQCEHAFINELNWEAQFSKIMPLFPDFEIQSNVQPEENEKKITASAIEFNVL